MLSPFRRCADITSAFSSLVWDLACGYPFTCVYLVVLYFSLYYLSLIFFFHILCSTHLPILLVSCGCMFLVPLDGRLLVDLLPL